jgi:hypothetical protein
VHRRNQARELIDADSILRDIAVDNPRNQAEINLAVLALEGDARAI